MVCCTTCGSGNVKKRSAIYEQGISRTSGTSRGVWVSGKGRVGVWKGSNSRVRITGAAAKNQPPSNVAPVFVFMCVLFGAELILLFSGVGFLGALIIALVAATLAAILTHKASKEHYATEREQYDRSWYCMKCGSVFEVELRERAALPLSEPRPAGEAASPSPEPRPIALRPLFPTKHLLTEYKDRILDPVQRAKDETSRDAVGLLDVFKRASSSYEFDPTQPRKLDLGLVSRLSSLGYVSYDETRGCYLTRAGLDRALSLSRRDSS